jgi:hypothetical protein
VKASFEAANGAKIKREKIKKQRTIRLCCERDHLAFLLFARLVKDVLQIRRFPAQAGSVVDDFAVNLARGEIDKAQ